MAERRIDRDEVRRVAKLARLRLTPEEEERLQVDLNDILTAFDALNALDTSGVEPTSHVVPVQNVLRPDVVGESLPRDQVLRNAPDASDGFFKVPRLMEEE